MVKPLTSSMDHSETFNIASTRDDDDDDDDDDGGALFK